MSKYIVISATNGAELACVWAGWHTEALAKALEMFPHRMVAVIG